MSAHLSGLAGGIYWSARVTNQTIIGYAGKTDNASIPVGDTHLHQAYYHYPRYKPDVLRTAAQDCKPFSTTT